jgi:hypothetical protein
MIDPVDIEDGDVKALVLLVFQRSIDLAVAVVEIEIAQMAGPACQRADQMTLKSYFASKVVKE